MMNKCPRCGKMVMGVHTCNAKSVIDEKRSEVAGMMAEAAVNLAEHALVFSLFMQGAKYLSTKENLVIDHVTLQKVVEDRVIALISEKTFDTVASDVAYVVDKAVQEIIGG